MAEDISGSVAVLANDTGSGNGPVTVSIASQPAHGRGPVAGGQTPAFHVPATDYNGADTFTYTVVDLDGEQRHRDRDGDGHVTGQRPAGGGGRFR